MNTTDSGFQYLSHIKISEIVFSEQTDLTLLCKVPNKEFHYYEYWNLFCDYNKITEILLYVRDEGDPIITRLTELLSSTFIEKPTVINIIELIGHELIVDGLTLKVFKTKKESQDGTWRYAPGENYFEIDSIIFNNNNTTRQVINKAKKAVDLLNDYYALLDNSYHFYIQLLSKGFSIEEARSRTGLKDELLFKIAITRHEITKFQL